MQRKINTPIDGGSVSSVIYDAYAGGNKQVQVASKLTFFPVTGPVGIKKGSIIYAFNKSASVEWLMLSNNPTPALAGFNEDWLPLKPMDWTILNSGDNEKINISSANVGVYLMFDDTVLK